MSIKTIIQRIFCDHDYKVLRWHWTHGDMGNIPLVMEAHIKCKKCGKEKYIYPERGSDLERFIMQHGAIHQTMGD